MRLIGILLGFGCMTAFAQGGGQGAYQTMPSFSWTLGLYRGGPSLSANIQGSRDGRPSRVNLEADLGLRQTGGALGGILEYQGGAHGFRLAYDAFRYEGQRTLTSPVILDGTAYPVGTPLRSKADFKALEGLWTYKFLRRPDAWVGLDLGAQVLRADLSAEALAGPQPSRRARPTLTQPRIGISAWSSGVEGLLESRIFYHYFPRRGATSTRYGTDFRAYLYPRFGIIGFFEVNRIKIPAGSTHGDLDMRMDTKFTGLGLVIRF